jgi:hypothetical protein
VTLASLKLHLVLVLLDLGLAGQNLVSNENGLGVINSVCWINLKTWMDILITLVNLVSLSGRVPIQACTTTTIR